MNATVTQTLRNQHEVYHGQKIAENAEDIWGWEKPTGPHRLERRTGYLIEHGDLTPEKLVLEIGCGTGVGTNVAGAYDETYPRAYEETSDAGGESSSNY
ncbi:hypothetical protein MK139_10905, partial [bacterium]|nr:hypothetical protein [bacterium]